MLKESAWTIEESCSRTCECILLDAFSRHQCNTIGGKIAFLERQRERVCPENKSLPYFAISAINIPPKGCPPDVNNTKKKSKK